MKKAALLGIVYVLLFGAGAGLTVLIGSRSVTTSTASKQAESTSDPASDAPEQTADELALSLRNNSYDTKRKTALSTHAAAQMEWISNHNGAYPKNALEATVAAEASPATPQALEPTTNMPFKLVDATPALGEIQYAYMSQCSDQNEIEKVTSTRMTALRTRLSDDKLTCINL